MSLSPDIKAGYKIEEKDGVVVQTDDAIIETTSKETFSTKALLTKTGKFVYKYARFFGPGLVISVAYIDPDNLQTNVTSGAQFKYRLLFMILVSNIIAVFLQVSIPISFANIKADRGIGTVNKTWVCYWHGFSTDESCFSS